MCATLLVLATPFRTQPNRKQIGRGISRLAEGLDNHAEHLTHQGQLLTVTVDRVGNLDERVIALEEFSNRGFGRRLYWLLTGK